jgi:hypothetical protein
MFQEFFISLFVKRVTRAVKKRSIKISLYSKKIVKFIVREMLVSCYYFNTRLVKTILVLIQISNKVHFSLSKGKQRI